MYDRNYRKYIFKENNTIIPCVVRRIGADIKHTVVYGDNLFRKVLKVNDRVDEKELCSFLIRNNIINENTEILQPGYNLEGLNPFYLKFDGDNFVFEIQPKRNLYMLGSFSELELERPKNEISTIGFLTTNLFEQKTEDVAKYDRGIYEFFFTPEFFSTNYKDGSILFPEFAFDVYAGCYAIKDKKEYAVTIYKDFVFKNAPACLMSEKSNCDRDKKIIFHKTFPEDFKYEVLEILNYLKSVNKLKYMPTN